MRSSVTVIHYTGMLEVEHNLNEQQWKTLQPLKDLHILRNQSKLNNVQ